MTLKFYTKVAMGLKLKLSEIFGLIPTFVEVTEQKLVGGRRDGDFLISPCSIGLSHK